jgi:hypothetical protein
MSNRIVPDDNSLNELVEIVMRQTDYNLDLTKDKLAEFNYDHIKVIKNYFGIIDKKEKLFKSANQEIYRQIRIKLDESMREYNERKVDENTVNKKI